MTEAEAMQAAVLAIIRLTNKTDEQKATAITALLTPAVDMILTDVEKVGALMGQPLMTPVRIVAVQDSAPPILQPIPDDYDAAIDMLEAAIRAKHGDKCGDRYLHTDPHSSEIPVIELPGGVYSLRGLLTDWRKLRAEANFELAGVATISAVILEGL